MGIHQILATDLYSFAHDDLLSALALLGGQKDRTGREIAGERLCHAGTFVDQMKVHLSGLTEQPFDRVRVLLARHLHEDARYTLALNGRFARADLVDPAAHDLERLLNGRNSAAGWLPCRST